MTAKRRYNKHKYRQTEGHNIQDAVSPLGPSHGPGRCVVLRTVLIGPGSPVAPVLPGFPLGPAHQYNNVTFLADRTNGRAYATVLRSSSVVVCRL